MTNSAWLSRSLDAPGSGPSPGVYSGFLKSGGTGRNPEIYRLEGPVVLNGTRGRLGHSVLRNG